MTNLLVFGLIQDLSLQKLIHESGTDEGHRVQLFQNCEDVLSAIQFGITPDLLLLEPVRLTSTEEERYLALIRSHPRIRVCLITRPGERYHVTGLRNLQSAVVLTKPILRTDIERLLEGTARDTSLCGRSAGQPDSRVHVSPKSSLATQFEPQPLIEELDEHRFFLALSPAMLEIYRQVKLLQGIDVSVLILGESGTGKEIVAHLIHKHSRRAQQKFVNVNCAALPMDLLESELFGHVKGAFTGAITDKPGRFEQANGGTILLDEIGEISAAMQAKLLHVLQDGQFTRLGARQPSRVDVHVLAATNISIENALANKTFREDLYYRLNTFTINVPPLRERTVEIPYLVNQMIARAPLVQSNGMTHFSRELMELLPQYSWPGNLRELRNFVLRTLIMQDETAAKLELEIKINKSVGPKHRSTTADTLHTGPMRSVVRDVRDRTETRMIEEALHASGWNRRDAARSLNISYRALLYKIQQYGLNPRSQRLVG